MSIYLYIYLPIHAHRSRYLLPISIYIYDIHHRGAEGAHRSYVFLPRRYTRDWKKKKERERKGLDSTAQTDRSKRKKRRRDEKEEDMHDETKKQKLSFITQRKHLSSLSLFLPMKAKQPSDYRQKRVRSLWQSRILSQDSKQAHASHLMTRQESRSWKLASRWTDTRVPFHSTAFCQCLSPSHW